MENNKAKLLDKKKRLFFALGTMSLLTVVFLWTFSSWLTSTVLDTYPQPFIVTVASSLSFLFYFVFLVIPDPLMYLMKGQKEISEGEEEQEGEETE